MLLKEAGLDFGEFIEINKRIFEHSFIFSR
jgi:hypothetical protein